MSSTIKSQGLDDFDLAVFEIMGEFGTMVTYLRQAQESEYDPATDLIVDEYDEIICEGLLVDLTLNSNGLSLKYGTLVEAGDKELYMRPPKTSSGLDAIVVRPSADFVRAAGVKWKIVTFKEVNPTGDAAILYTLYLRR